MSLMSSTLSTCHGVKYYLRLRLKAPSLSHALLYKCLYCYGVIKIKVKVNFDTESDIVGHKSSLLVQNCKLLLKSTRIRRNITFNFISVNQPGKPCKKT